MIDMTEKQREALEEIFGRKTDNPLTHEKFIPCNVGDCDMRGVSRRGYEYQKEIGRRLCIVEVEPRRLTAMAILRKSHASYETSQTTLEEFISTAYPGPGCIMVPWLSMQLGIEPDGHIHS